MFIADADVDVNGDEDAHITREEYAKRVNFYATGTWNVNDAISRPAQTVWGEVDRLKVSPAPQGEATKAVSSLFEILQFDKEGEFDDFCSGLTEDRKNKQVMIRTRCTHTLAWHLAVVYQIMDYVFLNLAKVTECGSEDDQVAKFHLRGTDISYVFNSRHKSGRRKTVARSDTSVALMVDKWHISDT
ncbi:hypothetical protein CAPTEDRAFT_211050 [Capitella teleta]|uniref:Uncharacterized protein n=1 Tax=Capitella teleta TaxID=283909 RepID=R7V7U8_CAPTE|nr:hypothetical protein CAPTEDRAFT_211050 [Capitella teleta]|eukprot:ELU14614.1 hypothetical protein CAPTEDRAFT_211050 [Capitella teleta]